MIAITGDVHGCVRTLSATADAVLGKYNIVAWYFLGDLIDRGPCSKECFDLFNSLAGHSNARLLLGNHEDLMASYIYNDARYRCSTWLANGGAATCMSFTGGKFSNPDGYHNEIYPYLSDYTPLLSRTELFAELELGKKRFVLSHAGLARPDLPISEQDSPFPLEQQRQHYGYIWNRQAREISTSFPGGKVQIFGHTPVQTLEMRGAVKNPDQPFVVYDSSGEPVSIDIDTGCVYGYYLTTVLIDEAGEHSFYSEKCRDRT